MIVLQNVPGLSFPLPRPARTWSLLITLFGDAILPRGGAIWLGSLLPIFARLGIAPGVLRTAASRLAADNWIERRRRGRHSFYRLTPHALAEVERASARIYGPPPPPFAGELRLLLPLAGADREASRPYLIQAGWGSLASGAWLAPPAAPPAAAPRGHVELCAALTREAATALAREAWPLEELADAYTMFQNTFAALGAIDRLPDLDALIARTLLIHEFRRIVLRDPGLPPDLLPHPWPGTEARALCAAAYAALLPGSERWLDAYGRDEHGRLPAAAAALAARFPAAHTSHAR